MSRSGPRWSGSLVDVSPSDSPAVTTDSGVVVVTVSILLLIVSFFSVADRAPTPILGNGAHINGTTIETVSQPFPQAATFEGYLFVLIAVGLCVGTAYTTNVWFDSYAELDQPAVRATATVLTAVVYVAWLGLALVCDFGVGYYGRDLIDAPTTFWILLLFHVVSVVSVVYVYSYRLIPRTFSREQLVRYNEKQWRLTRVLLSVTTAIAVGVSLPFVLSRANPPLFLAVFIVMTVSTAPFSIVVFLLLRQHRIEMKQR